MKLERRLKAERLAEILIDNNPERKAIWDRALNRIAYDFFSDRSYIIAVRYANRVLREHIKRYGGENE